MVSSSSLIAKTKLRGGLVIFFGIGDKNYLQCVSYINCKVFIIIMIRFIIMIITGAPSQSQRALQQTLAGKVIVGEGHHS